MDSVLSSYLHSFWIAAADPIYRSHLVLVLVLYVVLVFLVRPPVR